MASCVNMSRGSLLLILISMLIVDSNQELYSAVNDLEPLILVARNASRILEKYIQNESGKLDKMKKYSLLINNLTSVAIKRSFVLHPTNAYILIKRLSVDYENMKTILSKNYAGDTIKVMEKYVEPKLPSIEDWNGAADGLIRLQDVYNLTATQLSEGNISFNNLNITSTMKMSSNDAFELSKICNEKYFFNASKDWIDESIRLSKLDLIKLNMTSPEYELYPPNAREHEIEAAGRYHSLCQGQLKLSPKVASQLKCFFWNTTFIPFMKYVKIKVEEAYKEPHILIFHDVISDADINELKSLSNGNMSRALVHHDVGQLKAVDARVCKFVWFKRHNHEVVDKLYRRVARITGLNFRNAESFQVVNYGIGGQFDPHFDHFNKTDMYGTRIATWMFYMSDVEAGGATIFPLINVTVTPKKGSAIFWYNLLKNGDGDVLTYHAGCPVLAGSKWVGNIWIRERWQEFRRPCGLHEKERNLPFVMN